MRSDAGVMEMVDIATVIHVPIACEHSRHQTDGRHHGDAEWIQYDGPCKCPPGGSAFVCSSWRAWVRDLASRDGKLYCAACRESFPAHTMTYERI